MSSEAQIVQGQDRIAQYINRARIVVGKEASRAKNPLLCDSLARVKLVHTVQGILKSQRFGAFDEVKEHLSRQEVAADRCVVVFARHPATVYGGVGRLAGAFDVEISEQGQEQLPFLEQALEGVGFSHIYASNLQRSVIPARRFARSFSLPFASLEDLGEIHYGDWANRILTIAKGANDSIESAEPHKFRLFKEQPHLWETSGAETFWELETRVNRAIAEVVAENLGSTVLIIGHGWANSVACAGAFGIHLAHLKRLPLGPPTAINVLEYSSDLKNNRLWLWANAKHLPEDLVGDVRQYG